MQQEQFVADTKVLTVSEIASFFRCDPETVKRRARSGELPGFKFGKSWFFRMHDINRMIDTAIHAGHQARA